jgi:hypothetical protein
MIPSPHLLILHFLQRKSMKWSKSVSFNTDSTHFCRQKLGKKIERKSLRANKKKTPTRSVAKDLGFRTDPRARASIESTNRRTVLELPSKQTLFQMWHVEIPRSAPLFNLWPLHNPHGPPLSMGQQLCRCLQPKVLPTIPYLRLSRQHTCTHFDRLPVLPMLHIELLFVPSKCTASRDCRC